MDLLIDWLIGWLTSWSIYWLIFTFQNCVYFPENLRDLMDGVINARNLGQKADPEKYKFMTDTHVYQVISNYLGGSKLY